MEERWHKIKASTVQQKREEVYAALQYAAGLHCQVEERDCEELKPLDREWEAKRHRTEWCAAGGKY